MDRLLKVGEVAEILGTKLWVVWKLIWNGDLPSCRVGRFVRVRPSDVDAYLERNRRRVE